ncbi:cellulose biosynthesis protein BcsN [Methylobrevis albus]|nr:cellulose biosynthesis protein BcsN [Methylobrevis albus]
MRRDRRVHGRTGASGAWLSLALICLTIAGCAQSGRLETSSVSRIVGPENALVLPPPGGPAVLGIVERTFANAVQQDISLSTTARAAGQNLIRVQFFGPVDGMAAGDTRLANRPLGQSDFAAEFRELLPGVPMKTSPYYVQNRYGPFGYAVGVSSAGDLCLYAWQRIRAPDMSSTLFSKQGTIQLRLRLCEAGVSEETLLSVMYGLSINAFFKSGSWNPYGDPLPPPETLGRPGAPIYPGGQAGFTPVLTGVAAAPPADSAPRAAVRRSAAPAAPVVMPVVQTIPSPDAAPGTRPLATAPVDPSIYAPVPSPDAAGAVAAPLPQAATDAAEPAARAPALQRTLVPAGPSARPAAAPAAPRVVTPPPLTPLAPSAPASSSAAPGAPAVAVFPRVPSPSSVLPTPLGLPGCPDGAARSATGACPAAAN